MAQYFTVYTYVKPRIRQFLVQNYGSNVISFARDHTTYYQVRALLKKPSDKFFNPTPEGFYIEQISFRITEDDLSEYGCIIDNSGMRGFNRIFDMRLHIFMSSYVAGQFSIGIEAKKCITDFQEEFGYNEDIWPFETIRKYCQRNHIFDKGKTRIPMQQHISKIILENLSRFGTITNKAKKNEI